jgi:hypothetical protein
MQTTATSRAEHDLAYLAQQFEHWRQHRSSSFGPFPKPLWEQAIALTALLPLAQVAKHIRVRGSDLKKRCAAQQGAPSANGTPASLEFVELPVPPAWRRPTPSAEVELHRADGVRLRMQYYEPQPALAGVVRAFLETR